MNTLTVVYKAVLIATLALSLVSTTYANPEGYYKANKQGTWHKRYHTELKELNLSEQQREQMRTLMEESREKLLPQMEALVAERRKLREIMDARPVNPEAIIEQTQRIAKLEAELNIARAKNMEQMEALLTPEQQAKWRQIREERRKNAEEKMQQSGCKYWKKRSEEKPQS